MERKRKVGGGLSLLIAGLAIAAFLTASRLRVSEGFPVGTIVAQLGAYDEVRDATRVWKSIKKRFRSELAPFEPLVTRVECISECRQYDDREYFRLRVGPFLNIGKARAFCEELAAKLQSCIPLRER
ncbi:SPOR domain-containing protein [Ruegeria atlantica]|uniref:SPOR domain-containing protein n=1 Tax=Ruegeria atlantica TaxID=81569 RepID=UPI003D7DEF2B